MNARHLGMVYPFYALLTVLIVRSLGRFRVIFAAGLCLVLFISSSKSAATRYDREANLSVPARLVARAESILIDDPGRLVLPSAVIHLPDTRRVFAAHRRYLVKHWDRWADGLGAEALWVSHGRSEKARGEFQMLLRRLRQKYDVRRLKGRIGGRGRLLGLSKRAATP